MKGRWSQFPDCSEGHPARTHERTINSSFRSRFPVWRSGSARCGPSSDRAERTTRQRHDIFADQACDLLRWKERHTINAWMSTSNGIIGLIASSVCTGSRPRSVGSRWERAEMRRESGWLFSPATRTGGGQTNFGNISTRKATPFIGFSLAAALTRFSPSTLGKAAGSKSLSASSSTRGLTKERTSLSGVPTVCRHPSVVCCLLYTSPSPRD